MLLPDEVYVYGDCAINPDPNAEQLAEIAIQSADSAKAFGLDPRIAAISYSTGTSGAGAEVEKVAEATKIAQQRRPDLLIDGPLQYDAASVESVGRQKHLTLKLRVVPMSSFSLISIQVTRPIKQYNVQRMR